jgi:alpha-L-fucosidase
VLGQNDKALEYQADVVPQTTFVQTDDGLKIRAMRAQRLYNDRKWPNPVVIKLTHVKPALVPPRVESLSARRTAGGMVELRGHLHSLGDAKAVEAGAEYRDITGLDVNERLENWVASPVLSVAATGEFLIPVEGLKPDRAYELRAKVKHPLLTVFGAEVRIAPAKSK